MSLSPELEALIAPLIKGHANRQRRNGIRRSVGIAADRCRSWCSRAGRDYLLDLQRRIRRLNRQDDRGSPRRHLHRQDSRQRRRSRVQHRSVPWQTAVSRFAGEFVHTCARRSRRSGPSESAAPVGTGGVREQLHVEGRRDLVRDRTPRHRTRSRNGSTRSRLFDRHGSTTTEVPVSLPILGRRPANLARDDLHGIRRRR
jgi:hypothetical protein